MVDFRKKREERQGRRATKPVSARRRAEEHSTGGGWGTYLNIPEGVEMLSIKKPQIMRADIIPFIAGKDNPFANQGDPYFERTFYVHRDVGPQKGMFICLASTYGKPCPICEHRAELTRSSDADEDLIASLVPKERQLFNFLEHEETRKGVEKTMKLVEMSFHNFGKLLDMKVQSGDKLEDGSGEYDLFADLESGMTLRITWVQEQMGRTKFIKAGDIEFKPRNKPLPEEYMEQAVCLDDILKPMPYKKLKELFLQVSSAEDEEPEEEEHDEDDEAVEFSRGDIVSHPELGKCKVVNVAATGLTLKDRDGEFYREIDPEECDLFRKGK